MRYKIEVRALAVLEILDAFDWYELQQAGLGSDFFFSGESSRQNS